MVGITLNYTCPLCKQEISFNPETLMSSGGIILNTLFNLRTKLSACDYCKTLLPKEVRFNIIVEKNVLRCPNDNSVSFGGLKGKLKSLIKQIEHNKRYRREEYIRLLDIVKNLPKNKRISISDVIIGIEGKTKGEVQRDILDLLVCRGWLKKDFMLSKTTIKGNCHNWIKNEEKQPCPYLQEGKCSFSWKEAEVTGFDKFNWKKE